MPLINAPLSEYAFFAGIDPGFSGAISLMNATGTSVKVWDMPVTEIGKIKKYRALDLTKLCSILRGVFLLPRVCWGLENPTTRPGEGAERCFRFGRQIGSLEALLHRSGNDYCLISPMLWKNRLGLDGKTIAGANERAAEEFERLYPEHKALIHGPRGGILDGRMDALLICHFLRMCTGSETDRKFGKQSPEAFAYCASGGGKSHGKRPMRSLRSHTNGSSNGREESL